MTLYREEQVSDASATHSKVVVNRCMSLDGFIAAAGHVMDWGAGRQLTDFVGPDDFHEIAAATGAMLVGRRTSDVGDRMQAEKPGRVDYPRPVSAAGPRRRDPGLRTAGTARGRRPLLAA